jgi:hypothetical protein
MSTATPTFQRTWAGVVKGQPPPSVTRAPLPPLAACLLQLHKDCVERGTWARWARVENRVMNSNPCTIRSIPLLLVQI